MSEQQEEEQKKEDRVRREIRRRLKDLSPEEVREEYREGLEYHPKSVLQEALRMIDEEVAALNTPPGSKPQESEPEAPQGHREECHSQARTAVRPRIHPGISTCDGIETCEGEVGELPAVINDPTPQQNSGTDVKRGLLTVRDSKNSEPFEIPLILEGLQLLKEIAPGATEIPFYRHAPSKTYPSGRPYDEKLWYKYRKQARANLGVERVDLYGGTRHSTVRAMRHSYSPEQIRWATKHCTNKAFERYFDIPDQDLREMYEGAGQGFAAGGVDPVR